MPTAHSQRWQSYTALQIGKLTQEKADIVDAHSIEMREMQERLRRSRPAMSDAHNRTRAHTHICGGRSVRGLRPFAAGAAAVLAYQISRTAPDAAAGGLLRCVATSTDSVCFKQCRWDSDVETYPPRAAMPRCAALQANGRKH